MSWSATGTAIVDIENIALHIENRTLQEGYGDMESQAALEAAQHAVKALLRNRTFGLPPMGHGVFHISLSGHSNPAHEPTENWSVDYINISITKDKKRA